MKRFEITLDDGSRYSVLDTGHTYVIRPIRPASRLAAVAEGILQAFDIFGGMRVPTVVRKSKGRPNSAADELAGDWEAIGSDFRRVFERATTRSAPTCP